MQYIKAIFCLIEVLFYSIGIFPADMNISYGGDKYVAPEIKTEMYLVKDGKSDFVIVTEENPDECIVTATEELRTYIKKMSGAELEIKEETEVSKDDKMIIVGETEIGQSIKEFKSSEIKEDGFRLYSDGNHLIIFGEDSRGTLYGVYSILEDYLGVRWFTPKLEKVPESKNLVIDADMDVLNEPSFAIRRNSPAYADDKYRARNRTNVSFHYEAKEYGGALTYVLWDVTLDRLVPDALFAEHPEYFALLPDGTRSTDHVCLSHPDVLDIAVENARKYMRETDKETADHIHIGQKDNQNYCRCENCEALYEKYGGVSAPTLIFTNNFADALDEEFPEFTYTFYAYNETERPPQDLTLRCNKNVVPVLCELHHACRSHTLGTCGAIDDNQIESEFLNIYGDNEDFIAQDFKDWTVIAERTYIYDYTINFLFSAQFFSNFETMQSTMKYMHDIGITGYVYNCGDGHYAAFNDLRNYLLAKLQWNVDADVEYHMMDFMNFYYGEDAAPYIKEILDIQAGQIKATAHSFDFDWHYQSGYYTIPQIAKLDNLWKKACNADITDEQRFRVEAESLTWEFFKANQFLGEYFFLNPFRMQAQEELYDELLAHGITKVSSFSTLPANKEDMNFILRPINWE
ncbi:MAG: DUF4838 domain-containing protein [Clostridia bacterium]|nr:DUF4838 domain-containing protein [Clostridia bacterium]